MELLASTAIGLVGPYLAKGAEEFAKAAGKDAYAAATKLRDRLALWWAGDPVANAAAESLKDAPERNGKILGELLNEAFSADPAFAGEVKSLVDAFGPTARVVQKIEIAKGVTGAELGAFINGTLEVTQEMKQAENVVGLKSERFGR